MICGAAVSSAEDMNCGLPPVELADLGSLRSQSQAQAIALATVH